MYNYYPGCCLERDAVACHRSVTAVVARLGIELAELEDWSCCGATEYLPLDELTAHALVGRNLALAARRTEQSNQLVTPCSACFSNLARTDQLMWESPRLASDVNAALDAGGLRYDPGSVQVRHLLDVIAGDVGLDAVARKVTRPLTGMRVAPYYGCLNGGPGCGGQDDDYEPPTSLEELTRVLGAEVVDFARKTDCCGGHMDQIGRDGALERIWRLHRAAAESGADAIVTVCPMCRLNLVEYQDNVNQEYGTEYGVSVLYFTQLMGLAFGLPDELPVPVLPSVP